MFTYSKGLYVTLTTRMASLRRNVATPEKGAIQGFALVTRADCLEGARCEDDDVGLHVLGCRVDILGTNCKKQLRVGRGQESERLDRGNRPKKTGETVDRRQNNGSVKAVSPRHCPATCALRNCCFNCCAGQSH